MKSLPTKVSKKGQIPSFGLIFYIMYADFEEKHGLLSYSMAIFDEALKNIADDETKYLVFDVYLKKASEYYGVIRCRSLYERSFETLSGANLIKMGKRFAALEMNLGEIDRARGVY